MARRRRRVFVHGEHLKLSTSNPRSSAVRSSDMAHNTFHRQSISAKYPRHIGDAALIAN